MAGVSSRPAGEKPTQAVTPASSPAPGPRGTTKRQRQLACRSCQQRKIKCDRKSPCAACVKSGTQCVAPSGPRPRRPRFPERELLNRLRRYEELLRRHAVDFEGLHSSGGLPGAAAGLVPWTGGGKDVGIVDGGDLDVSGEEVAVRSGVEAVYERPLSGPGPDDNGVEQPSPGCSNFRHAVMQMGRELDDDRSEILPGAKMIVDGQRSRDDHPRTKHSNDDDAHNVRAEKEHDQASHPEADDDGNDHLLFGPCPPVCDLPALHAEQGRIFRIWQVYLENVSPLLRVTHSPTLQARLVDAASQAEGLSPAFKALIFSICCVAIMSLSDDRCRSLFDSPRRDLLERYQPACRQALRRCRFWRCESLDALTASYLYLISVRPQSDPRSLASATAAVLRTAQRMGLHSESVNAGCDALEGEMRRRLWWSLVVFDQRICEMTEYGTTTLLPTWDCRRPANASDFEIRPGSVVSSAVPERPTEALFAVVLSAMADHVRHSSFHLDFVNPALKALARARGATNDHSTGHQDTLMSLESAIEGRYLARCDPSDPLHFMTTWTARGYMARHRLLEHYARHAASPPRQTEAQRLAALSHAVRMLECDTKLRAARPAQGFLWLVDSCVPILAYFHILHHLRRRPAAAQAGEAWGVMSENWAARAALRAIMPRSEARGAFATFSRLVLEAWAGYEDAHRGRGEVLTPPPPLVADIRDRLQQRYQTGQGQRGSGRRGSAGAVGVDSNESASPPAAPESLAIPGGSSGGEQYPLESCHAENSDLAGDVLIDIDMDDFWTTMDWSLMHAQGW